MFQRLQKEGEDIISSVIELSWYSRGSIPYKDMMEMTYAERTLVREFIDRRMETIKDHRYPIY